MLRNIGSAALIRQSVTSAGPSTSLDMDSVVEQHPIEPLHSLGVAKHLIGVGVRVYEVAFWVSQCRTSPHPALSDPILVAHTHTD